MDAPAVVTENKAELTHGYGADEVFTISTTPETTLSLVSESVNNLIFNSANKTVTAKANLAAGTYTLRLKAEAQYYTPFLFDIVVEVVPAAEVAWTVTGADGEAISPDKAGVYQLPVNRSEGGRLHGLDRAHERQGHPHRQKRGDHLRRQPDLHRPREPVRGQHGGDAQGYE